MVWFVPELDQIEGAFSGLTKTRLEAEICRRRQRGKIARLP